MKFFLSIEPSPPKVTHQMHRIAVLKGKPIVYDGPSLRKARELFIQLLSQVMPEEPLKGPVELTVVWRFPCPKKRGASFPAENKTGGEGWKISKPDTDNLEKLLKDCMTACRFWKDDAQVAREIVEKIQTVSRHGVFVQVREMPPLEVCQ